MLNFIRIIEYISYIWLFPMLLYIRVGFEYVNQGYVWCIVYILLASIIQYVGIIKYLEYIKEKDKKCY